MNEKADIKELAREFFIRSSTMTQKECAKKFGVTEKTMSDWVIKGKWLEQREALHTTPAELIIELNKQLSELRASIANRAPGERFPTSSEANVQNLLLKGIRDLGASQSLSVYVEVCMGAEEWVRGQRKFSDDFVKQFGEALAEYLATKAKKKGGSDA